MLYTQDLEPITILKIPVDVQEEIERKGMGKVPVLDGSGGEARYMYIYPIRVVVRGQHHLWFCTRDEELALTIKPEWLPGQLPMIQHMQKIIYEQQRTLKRLGGDNNKET